MTNIIILSGSLLIILTIFVTTYILSAYSVHLWNKKRNIPYDYAHFSNFLKELDKYKDYPLEYNISRNSITLPHKVDIFDDTIIFNNKVMILYPISFIRYCLWQRKTFRAKREKGIWS